MLKPYIVVLASLFIFLGTQYSKWNFISHSTLAMTSLLKVYFITAIKLNTTYVKCFLIICIIFGILQKNSNFRPAIDLS